MLRKGQVVLAVWYWKSWSSLLLSLCQVTISNTSFACCSCLNKSHRLGFPLQPTLWVEVSGAPYGKPRHRFSLHDYPAGPHRQLLRLLQALLLLTGGNFLLDSALSRTNLACLRSRAARGPILGCTISLHGSWPILACKKHLWGQPQQPTRAEILLAPAWLMYRHCQSGSMMRLLNHMHLYTAVCCHLMHATLGLRGRNSVQPM